MQYFLEILGEHSRAGIEEKVDRRKVAVQNLLRLRQISWPVPRMNAGEAGNTRETTSWPDACLGYLSWII